VECSPVNIQGEKVQCEMFYAPIQNTKGRKMGIAVLIKDITRRLQDKVDLREQKQHLNDIFGFAPIGIYHVDMEGQVLSANPEYAWMLGYESSEAVIEQTNDFLGQVFFDEKDAEEFMSYLYEAEEVMRFRCRLKKKDNSFVWALCYAKITHDETGRMNGFNGFSIDIGETVRVEQQLREANRKLKMLWTRYYEILLSLTRKK